MANGIFLFFVFVSLVSGLSRGPQRQLWSLAVLAVSAYISGNAYTAFLTVIRPFIESEAGARFASFAIIFCVMSAVLGLTVDALLDREYRRKNDFSLGERLAGGFLGAVHAVATAEVLAALVLMYPVLQWDRWILEADIFGAIFRQWPFMLSLLPSDFRQVLEMLR